MTERKETLGTLIKRARKEKRLTQEELAETMDITSTYLSQIENDRKDPSLSLAKRIADELDISMDLMTGRRVEKWRRQPTRSERILSDCNNFEYEMIIGIMEQTKRLLRQNAPLNK